MADELAPLCDSSATGPGSRGRPGIEQTGHALGEVREAQVVGAEQDHAERLGAGGELGLRRPARLPRLAVAGREHDRVADPGRRGVAQRSSVPACGTIRNATSTGSPISAQERTVGWPWVTAPRRLTR